MPDQSSAATEHSILEEISGPLSHLPDDPVHSVADVDFPIVLRGYDRLAVDEYVQKTSRLVAELQSTRSPEAAVRRALERVGEEVSGILTRAHETADRITTHSRSEAEDRLMTARAEAEQITSEAHSRVKELDAETDRIWAERHRIVEDARELARQMLVLADSASERFPAEETGSHEAQALPADAADPGEPFDAELATRARSISPFDAESGTPEPSIPPFDPETPIPAPPAPPFDAELATPAPAAPPFDADEVTPVHLEPPYDTEPPFDAEWNTPEPVPAPPPPPFDGEEEPKAEAEEPPKPIGSDEPVEDEHPTSVMHRIKPVDTGDHEE
jgi:DivIVA protein